MLLRVIALILIANAAIAQTPVVHELTSGTKTSLRGLSAVSDKIIWVSGSKGTVGRSTDAGKTWEWITVPGFEQRELRDIHAFDAKTAIVIAIAEPGNILKTRDGGKSWETVFTDSTKGIFLDALDFADAKNGIVVGDPIDHKAYIVTTSDTGNTWQSYAGKPITLKEGEAFFAASGSNINYQSNGHFKLVSGGTASRLITPDEVYELPLLQGKETTGANSIAVSGNHLFIAGGDFAADTSAAGNAVIIDQQSGFSVKQPATPPHGYRSCVEFISSQTLIACGTTGVDLSKDGGNNWQLISKDGYHVCAKARKGKAVFLAGNNGKVAVLITK